MNFKKYQTSILVKNLGSYRRAMRLAEQHDVEKEDGYATELFTATKAELVRRAPSDKTADTAVRFIHLL